MSKQAVTYVQRLGITDQHAEQVFLLLAERTEIMSNPWDAEIPEIMGLEVAPPTSPRSLLGSASIRKGSTLNCGA